MREKDNRLDPHKVARDLNDLLAKQPESELTSDELNALIRKLGAQPSSPAELCPVHSVWVEYAEGDRGDEAGRLLSHAASCSTCSAELRRIMQQGITQQRAMQQTDMQETLNLREEDDEEMHGLASSTPEWQLSMSRQLAVLAAAPQPSDSATTQANVLIMPQRHPRWQIFGAIAAGFMLAAGGATFLWIHFNPSDSALLARAYDEQRLTALRMPGGDDVSQATFTRGRSAARGSEALGDLDARIARHLAKAPQDAYWLQMRGRADLLRNDPQALDDLHSAQSEAGIAHQTIAGIEEDLGSAWFEAAERSGRASDYAEAAELFSRALAQPGANRSVLFYNRALCWERQGLNRNALDDLRAALAIERSASWRNSIEHRIVALSAHTSAPANDGFEAAASAALGVLGKANPDPSAQALIARAAELGLHHHDRWFSDWRAEHLYPSAAATGTASASFQLSEAFAASHAGRYEDIFSAANKSKQLFHASADRAGELRARALTVYSLQRLGRDRPCLQAAAGLASSLEPYALLHAQLLLDQGSCAAREGDYRAAARSYTSAAEVASTAGLPFARLAALEAQAELLSLSGNAFAAWNLDASLQPQCLRLQCPAQTQFAITYNMADTARQLGRPYIAAELMRTAVAFSATGTPVAHAYAVETLATLEGKAGNFRQSASDFTEALRIARSTDGRITPIYQALWQIDQAQVLSQQGRTSAALDLLAQSTPSLLAASYAPGRIAAYSQLSAAELAAGRSSEALLNAQHAVEETERGLSSLRTRLDREQWARDNAPVYARLIEAQLRRGYNTAALETWERFRAAPFAASFAGPVRDRARSASTLVGPAARVIVLARVGDVYVGWLARTHPLAAERTLVLGPSDRLLELALTFFRLCAEPGSDLAELHHLGAALYSAFLQPFDAAPQPGRHLWLDLDPSLEALPVVALTVPTGAWLSASARISELAPWWSLRAPALFDDSALPVPLRLFVLSGFTGIDRDTSEVSELVRRFPSLTLLDASAAPHAELLRALDAAEIFHYSGHAQGGQDPTLAPDTSPTEAGTALTPELFAGHTLHACRLAVLAACNTSGALTDPGESEPLPGFRSSLLEAGARNVVASNWYVDNASTRALMLDFYAGLHSGMTPSMALQNAEHTVSSQSTWQHPFYWAAFQSFTQ